MEIKERQDFQSLKTTDFTATKFFQHLSNGTTFFQNKEYERAITEWQETAKRRPTAEDLPIVTKAAAFRSRLDDVPLLGLLYTLFSFAQTGVAAVVSNAAQKEILFKEGWIVSARTNQSEERLGNFIQQRDLLASFNLEEVAAQAKESKEKLGAFLVKGGLLSDKELLELLDFQAKEILSELFSWKEGEFDFEKQEVKEEDVVVSYTPLDIALFAARRGLSFANFRRMIPKNEIVFYIPPNIERDKTKVIEDLDANEWFIFSLIDGNRNVDDLIKFSGDNEISVINILYRLLLMGMIKKSQYRGTYDNIRHREITMFVRTFLEVFRLVLGELEKELGVRAKGVTNNVMEQLAGDYGKLFSGVTMYNNLSLDEKRILKNISYYYFDPSDNAIFIDGFYTLLRNILQEMVAILGLPLTKRVVADIAKIRHDIYRFYTDSPIKRKVLDAFDKIVAQYHK